MKDINLNDADCHDHAKNDQKSEADQLKMLEISEAIHDLDSKLTDLEIALRINRG